MRYQLLDMAFAKSWLRICGVRLLHRLGSPAAARADQHVAFAFAWQRAGAHGVIVVRVGVMMVIVPMPMTMTIRVPVTVIMAMIV